MKKVLIVPGGGVFGYIPSYFISKAVGTGDLANHIDAIGGTSVGGILSLAYGSGMNPEATHEMFESLVTRAFKSKWYTPFRFWRPKYDGKELIKAMQGAMGTKQMHELSLPTVIPSINFENNSPKIWDNLANTPDKWWPAWEVGRMTSAAPTFFPPWKGHIDGGLIANNPIMETTIALKHKMGWKLEDMDVLVVGTGKTLMGRHRQSKVESWGKLRWLMPLIGYLTYANEATSEFMSKQIGLGKVTIYDPVVLEASWAMDDPDLIPTLKENCEQHEHSAVAIIREFMGIGS